MQLSMAYSFYGGNLGAYRCRDAEVMLAGPRDTGKTLSQLTKLHHAALKYPGASIVICRKQLTDVYSTVLVTFQREVAKDAIDQGVVTVKGGSRPWYFEYPKDARIWVAGLDKPGKVLSGQHDIIYDNQAEESSLADWEMLNSSTTGRAGHMPYNQTIGDCNPGPPSHWIQRRKKDGLLTFYESRHRDNPTLFDQETGDITDDGVRRMEGLRRLTGSRKQRLFHGLWVAPEGAIYEVFEEARHVVKSFPIPQLWPRTVGVDPVGAHVAAVWLAWDPQAQVLHVYREYSQPFGIPTRQHVENVKKLSRNEAVHAWVVGAVSERQPRQDWIDAGVPAIPPPYADVWAGIDKVNELLADSRMFIHDNCPGLISDVSDYHRKMGKDGEPGETIEGKERYHLCLAYHTLVKTKTGAKTIRNVKKGDYVLTPDGYHRVTGASRTSPAAPVMTVHFSNGRTLTGTPDHPVYVKGKGYIALHALRYGDIIETPENKEVSLWPDREGLDEKKSRMMGVSGIDTPMQRGAPNQPIIPPLSAADRCICIGMFMKSITARFLTGMRSIIRTTTAKTMTRPISKLCLLGTICQGTGRIDQRNTWKRIAGRWIKRAWQQQNGTDLRKVGHGIAYMASVHGKTASPLRLSASTAESNLRPSQPTATRSSVLTSASQPHEGHLVSTMHPENVPVVDSSSWPTNTKKQNTVPICVLSVIDNGEVLPVYNLTVDTVGEYYANGVLVHNCDSIRYACAWLTAPMTGQVRVGYDPVPIGERRY